MVCKYCGTEGRGSFCACCGAPLNEDEAPQSEKAIVAMGKEERPTNHRKPTIRLRMVFAPTLTLFFPVLFLFSDLFILFTKDLYTLEASGTDRFSLLFSRLLDSAYDANAVSDLVASTYGAGTTLYETVSLRSVWAAVTGGSAGELSLFTVPVLFMAVMILLSVGCGLLILFSGGRILRRPLFSDFMVFAGGTAALSPLLSNLLLRISALSKGGFVAADELMSRVIFSFESLCYIGISLSLFLPAMVMLRRCASFANGFRTLYMPAPFRCAGDRAFPFMRIFSLLCAGVAMLCPFLFFFTDVFSFGKLSPRFDFSSFGKNVKSAATLLAQIFRDMKEGGSIAQMAAPFDTFFRLFLLPVMLFAFLLALICVLRVAFVRGDCSKSKRKRRLLLRLSRRARAPLFSPFMLATALQTVAVILLLLRSHLIFHLNFSSVSETLTLLYATVLYVKNSFGTTTLFALIAFVGTVFSILAGYAAGTVLRLSGRSGK